jgi:hypothetical protein
VLLLAALVSACSGGGGPSVADGKRAANAARRPVAEAYWKLDNSIGTAASHPGGEGVFARCEGGPANGVVYSVRTVLGSRRANDTPGRFTAAVADRLARAGWQLAPSSGLPRSASNGDLRVDLEPPEVGGASASVALVVSGKCVDVGAAANVLLDIYVNNKTDRYPESRAAESPIPTTFP